LKRRKVREESSKLYREASILRSLLFCSLIYRRDSHLEKRGNCKAKEPKEPKCTWLSFIGQKFSFRFGFSVATLDRCAVKETKDLSFLDSGMEGEGSEDVAQNQQNETVRYLAPILCGCEYFGA